MKTCLVTDDALALDMSPTSASAPGIVPHSFSNPIRSSMVKNCLLYSVGLGLPLHTPVAEAAILHASSAAHPYLLSNSIISENP